MIAEPGRFFVADAAALVTTVKSVRRVPWRRGTAGDWVATDHLEVHIDDGIYGNLMGQAHDDRRWELQPLDRREVSATLPAHVWGATCDTYDRIDGLRMLPADLAAGERLLVPAAGAYSLTTSTRFNCTAPTHVFAFDGDEAIGVTGAVLDPEGRPLDRTQATCRAAPAAAEGGGSRS